MELKHELTPLDLAILPLLPQEGSMLGKFHPLGRLVRDLVKELDDPYTTSNKVQTRLRLLKDSGLVVDVRPGGDRIWQRTPAGDDALRERGIQFKGSGQPEGADGEGAAQS